MTGDQYEIAAPDQLVVGMTVEVLFAGLIRERYPISVDADEILVILPQKENTPSPDGNYFAYQSSVAMYVLDLNTEMVYPISQGPRQFITWLPIQ